MYTPPHTNSRHIFYINIIEWNEQMAKIIPVRWTAFIFFVSSWKKKNDEYQTAAMLTPTTAITTAATETMSVGNTQHM